MTKFEKFMKLFLFFPQSAFCTIFFCKVSSFLFLFIINESIITQIHCFFLISHHIINSDFKQKIDDY